MKWITSNAVESQWHLGQEREIRGDVSGNVFSRYLVAACSGKTLGGSWGQSVKETNQAPENSCKYCLKRAKMREAQLAMGRDGDRK